jgi:hypothetical protein
LLASLDAPFDSAFGAPPAGADDDRVGREAADLEPHWIAAIDGATD